MMDKSLTMTLDFLSYWHIGTGDDAGNYADSLVVKDIDGLPFVPGKSLKGILRHKFQEAQENGWFETVVINEKNGKSINICNLLFGAPGITAENQGIIQISSARLSEIEVQEIRKNPQLCRHFFSLLKNTAIDPDNGVVKDKSLRTIEVATPMQLQSRIDLCLNSQSQQDYDCWLQTRNAENWLNHVVQLVWWIGTKRNRGLGQVVISLSSHELNTGQQHGEGVSA